jgi:hypothetical protein
MGYDIHITRRADWSDESGRAIADDEWSRLAAGDPALRHAPDSGIVFYEYAEGNGWFDLADGCILSKNPSKATLGKAHELAAKLRAKVQGDDGEVYLPNGERVGNDMHVVVKYPWWLLVLCLFSIGCFVVVLLHVLTGG